jgi:hypothetical protein
MVTLSLPVAVTLLVGCSEDDTPTQTNTVPSAAGQWRGSCVTDFGQAMPIRRATVTATITQNGYDLGGNWRWLNQDDEQTLYYFRGRLSASRVISIEETSFVAENWNPGGALDLLITWSGTLSASGDSIDCHNVLPPNESYPIRTVSLVKQ